MAEVVVEDVNDVVSAVPAIVILKHGGRTDEVVATPRLDRLRNLVVSRRLDASAENVNVDQFV
jgi:hypothetical protein